MTYEQRIEIRVDYMDGFNWKVMAEERIRDDTILKVAGLKEFNYYYCKKFQFL